MKTTTSYKRRDKRTEQKPSLPFSRSHHVGGVQGEPAGGAVLDGRRSEAAEGQRLH